MIITLLAINTIAIAFIIYRQQHILNMVEENANALTDIWNYVSGNPEMSIDKE